LDNAWPIPEPATPLLTIQSPLYIVVNAGSDLVSVFSRLSTKATAPTILVPAGAVLPYQGSLSASYVPSDGFAFQLLYKGAEPILLADVAIASVATGSAESVNVDIRISISKQGAIELSVCEASGNVLQSVSLPASA
jgi:hypothetical protein